MMMSKLIIAALLILCCTFNYANVPYELITGVSKNGSPYMFVRNYTRVTISCVFEMDNGDFFDIEVRPNSDSRKYAYPNQGFVYSCG